MDENENVKQINISNINTNNLSNLNQRNSNLADYSNKRAFTEPSAEYPFEAYNSNQISNKTAVDISNQRIFPVIECLGNFQNEDSFDFSVNEE